MRLCRFPGLLLRVLVAGAFVVLSGQARADWAEGVLAYERGDYAAALQEWRPLAEHGDARAQAALGSLYIYGNGVELDYAQGLDWTRQAAEQGDVTGLFNMGTIYAEGLGVVQDYEIAARYFRKAAARDDAASRYNLGVMYACGLGVIHDNIEACLLAEHRLRHRWSARCRAAAIGRRRGAARRDAPDDYDPSGGR